MCVCFSVCLSVYLPAYLSVGPSVRPSSVRPSVCLSVFFICLVLAGVRVRSTFLESYCQLLVQHPPFPKGQACFFALTKRAEGHILLGNWPAKTRQLQSHLNDP